MSSNNNNNNNLPSVLIVGTGEYVTGYVSGKSSNSDKKIGVVALTCFDLVRRRKLDKVLIAGTNGTKFPGIRTHFKENIEGVYSNLSTAFQSFPDDNVASDPEAYLKGINRLSAGDIVIIVTPDDTHFAIAKAAIEKKIHVLITKPPVQKLSDQKALIALAEENKVLVAVEYHKAFDPMYSDAKEKIQGLGDFSYFYSYMSQPKFQLETFRAWAGKSSDINYYLNAHHIDFHCWASSGFARPTRVQASCSRGVANQEPLSLTPTIEDTISLLVTWQNSRAPHSPGHAIYTASWIAPKSDVHSQQRFHYMGAKGEIMVDQAHRGFHFSTDEKGLANVNPLYMRYTPDERGRFVGQSGYGYKSLDLFADAVLELRNGGEMDLAAENLRTIQKTALSTAILEAGRLSLDNSGRSVVIKYGSASSSQPTEIALE